MFARQLHISIKLINNQFLSKSISIHSNTTSLPELFVLLIMWQFVFIRIHIAAIHVVLPEQIFSGKALRRGK